MGYRVRSGPLSYSRRRSEHPICQHFGLIKYLAAQTIHFSEIRSFEFWFRIWITLTDELKMETSLPTVRQKSLDQTHKAKYCKRPRLFVFGMLALQRYINILCKYKIYFKNTDNNNLKINLMKRYYINRRRSNGIERSL